MGCQVSSSQGGGQNNSKKSMMPRTPILLLSLPGDVKRYVQRLLGFENGIYVGTEKLSVRFVDIDNSINTRKNWYKELSSRRDFASIMYFADLRDHPMLLLNIRTVNWIIRTSLKKFKIHVIALYDSDEQIREFREYLDSSIDFLTISEKNQDSIDGMIRLLTDRESVH